MRKPKTDLEIFIEAAGSVWRAIGELENVALRHSPVSLKREAAKASETLQKILDGEVRDWNDDEYSKISLCKAQATFGSSNDCDIYTVNEVCAACAALAKAEAA